LDPHRRYCDARLGADAFGANIVRGVFTHYKREEDTTMTSGKFDEELSRMNTLGDMLGQHTLILFNESFASTNEREGSEIARQIVTALLDSRMKVFFVTHMYPFAHAMEEMNLECSLFLRAERREDGSRTFKQLFSPGICWSGLRLNRLGSIVHRLQMNS
jgi:DNA mismatch repair ATPase MutS